MSFVFKLRDLIFDFQILRKNLYIKKIETSEHKSYLNPLFMCIRNFNNIYIVESNFKKLISEIVTIDV